MDHPDGAMCEAGVLLLEELDRQVEESPVADDWKAELRRVKRQFRLDDNLLDPIQDFDAFRTAVEGLVTFDQRSSIAALPVGPESVTPAPKRTPVKRARRKPTETTAARD